MKRLVMVLLVAVLLTTATAMTGAGHGQNPEVMCVVHGLFPLTRPIEVPEEGFMEAKRQVFPEGCLGFGFETWLMLYNAGPEPADVVVVAAGNEAYLQSGAFTVRPGQRQTYLLNHTFASDPANFDYFIKNPDAAFKVLSTSKDLYAQVSMYWNNRAAGHTSAGFTEVK